MKAKLQTNLKKTAPNLLTLLRLALACWLVFQVASHFDAVAAPLVASALIYLTDFLDGRLARRWGCPSRFGMIFDVAADFFYITSFNLTLVAYGVLPLWYAAAVACKFLEFLVTSAYMNQRRVEKQGFVFDRIGKITAAGFYALPLAAYLCSVLSPSLYQVVNPYGLVGVVGMAVVSSAWRIASCIGWTIPPGAFSRHAMNYPPK